MNRDSTLRERYRSFSIRCRRATRSAPFLRGEVLLAEKTFTKNISNASNDSKEKQAEVKGSVKPSNVSKIHKQVSRWCVSITTVKTADDSASDFFLYRSPPFTHKAIAAKHCEELQRTSMLDTPNVRFNDYNP